MTGARLAPAKVNLFLHVGPVEPDGYTRSPAGWCSPTRRHVSLEPAEAWSSPSPAPSRRPRRGRETWPERGAPAVRAGRGCLSFSAAGARKADAVGAGLAAGRATPARRYALKRDAGASLDDSAGRHVRRVGRPASLPRRPRWLRRPGRAASAGALTPPAGGDGQPGRPSTAAVDGLRPRPPAAARFRGCRRFPTRRVARAGMGPTRLEAPARDQASYGGAAGAARGAEAVRPQSGSGSASPCGDRRPPRPGRTAARGPPAGGSALPVEKLDHELIAGNREAWPGASLGLSRAPAASQGRRP